MKLFLLRRAITSSCLECPTMPCVPATPVPVAAFSLPILSQISKLETATPSFLTQFLFPSEWPFGRICQPAFPLHLCTSQLKPPPFGSRGRVGDNRGIKSLLNNKLSPEGGSFDWFRLWVPSPRGAAVKRETGYQFFIWSFQRWRKAWKR